MCKYACCRLLLTEVNSLAEYAWVCSAKELVV